MTCSRHEAKQGEVRQKQKENMMLCQNEQRNQRLTDLLPRLLGLPVVHHHEYLGFLFSGQQPHFDHREILDGFSVKFFHFLDYISRYLFIPVFLLSHTQRQEKETG